MHHNFVNFSFMPITGALNNKKGTSKHPEEAKSLDRFDYFINMLNDYYTTGNEMIFMKFNKEPLKWYLGKFNDIYDYCEKIYLIDDKDFVDEIIDSGKKAIITRESALNYMKLAQKYWTKRREKMKSYGVFFD